MSNRDLSTYDDVIAVVEALPALVRETRRRRGLSLRQVGTSLDVDFNTLGRFERGRQVHSGTLVTLLRWVGTPDPDAARDQPPP